MGQSQSTPFTTHSLEAGMLLASLGAVSCVLACCLQALKLDKSSYVHGGEAA